MTSLRTLLASAALATAALVVPAAPAHAAATCQGQTATHEVTGGTVDTGPANDVVVVTGPGTSVQTGDGDDLVCVAAGATGLVRVDTGAGADVVDTTTSGAESDVVLGPGADRFLGGPLTDTVRSSGDLETDSIATGGGDDRVTAYDGGALVIDLGPDDDILSFVSTLGTGPSTLDLGLGRDLAVVSDVSPLVVDLQARQLSQNGVTSRIEGVEDVQATGSTVLIRGTQGKNELQAVGCIVTMYGGNGRDSLVQAPPPGGGPLTCEKRRAKLFGKGGNDTLRGGAGNDKLIGGSGVDTTYGGRGRDQCIAEKESQCER